MLPSFERHAPPDESRGTLNLPPNGRSAPKARRPRRGTHPDRGPLGSAEGGGIDSEGNPQTDQATDLAWCMEAKLLGWQEKEFIGLRRMLSEIDHVKSVTKTCVTIVTTGTMTFEGIDKDGRDSVSRHSYKRTWHWPRRLANR